MTVKSRLLELLEQHKGETLSGEDIGRGSRSLESCEQSAPGRIPH
jgi:biotin operon repressor